MNIPETFLYDENSRIVCHSIRGKMSVKTALTGVENALEFVRRVVKKYGRFNLLLDVKEYIFEDIEAHKVWSLGFKENELLKKYVIKTAVVGEDSLKLRTEKEMMETDQLSFFTGIDEAADWLSL